LANFTEGKAASAPEEKEAARAFVGMFDHNSIKLRNFTGLGRDRNRRDELNRYNTELYYTATQTPMPDHIQKLIEIDNQNAGWKDSLFTLYDNYDKEYRQAKSKDGYAKVKQDVIEQTQKEVVVPKLTKVLGLMRDEKSNFKGWNKILGNVPEAERQQFSNFMSKWDLQLLDEKSEVPPNYLLWAGLKQPSKTLERLINEKEVYSKKSLEFKTKAEKIRHQLESILAAKGYNFKMPALKMAYIKYKKMMSKIAQLLKFKKSSLKFAFINTSSIDDTIEGVRKDFDHFFDNLLK